MTTRQKHQELKNQAAEFVTELTTWMKALNETREIGRNSDYYDVRYSASYFDSIDFHDTPTNGVLNFGIAETKFLVTQEINTFTDKIVFNTYEFIIDVNKGGKYVLKPDLKVTLAPNTRKQVGLYLDSIIEHLITIQQPVQL